MRKELTEKWKNGTLGTGYYYFKTSTGVVVGFQLKGFKYPYTWRGTTIDDVSKVLAPVPSYATSFKSEHTLRRCKRWINMQCVGGPATDVKKELLEQIDECLKELR